MPFDNTQLRAQLCKIIYEKDLATQPVIKSALRLLAEDCAYSEPAMIARIRLAYVPIIEMHKPRLLAEAPAHNFDQTNPWPEIVIRIQDNVIFLLKPFIKDVLKELAAQKKSRARLVEKR